MSLEKRGVRPFDTLDATQSLLNRTIRLQSPPIPDGFQPPLGNLGLTPIGVQIGQVAGPGGTLVLEHDQYVGGPIGLYYCTNDDDWQTLTAETGKELDRIFGRRMDAPVNVVVSLANTRLKQVEILSSETFAEWASNDWRRMLTKRATGKQRPRALRMPADGCVLSIRFLLHSDLPPARRIAGRPWRKGSWLARVDINISSAVHGGLQPRPMNDAIRERFGLGSHTSLFVEFRGNCSGLHAVTDLSDVVSVYIDESLLAGAMELTPQGKPIRAAGDSLVNRWVLDTYRTLIDCYSKDDRLEEFDVNNDEHRRTFLFSMLSRVEEACRISVEEGLLVLKDQPTRFAALFEHVLAVRQSDELLLGLRK